MNTKKNICILCKNANQETFSFAETLNEEYTIYICIDNNDSVLPEYNKLKINIIRFYNNEPDDNYFKGSVDYAKNRACSRDKALYYFCKINTNYEYIWFLEDDVFIPNKDTIPKIDKLYKLEDLLSCQNVIKKSRDDNSQFWQHWDKNNNKIDFPWAHSMICAIRVSKKLMECILEFVNNKKYLLFDELLFNTIALQNNLLVVTPIELSNIVFSFHDIIPDNINENYLYHPIKNLKKHEELRNTYKIIVARYNENINWLKDEMNNCIIYNKGNKLNIDNEIILENKGRESETYLHYIITNYYDLPDVVVFTQGRISDHVHNDIQYLITIKNDAFLHGKSEARVKHTETRDNQNWQWNRNWNMICGSFKRDAYKNNVNISFYDWFITNIDDKYPSPIHIYNNGIFAVKKEKILQRSIDYYKKLILEVNYHINPIEGHFFERSWYYIFNL